MIDEALGSAKRPMRVAVVGAGPSGFYAAQAYFQTADLEVELDLYDRLPTPFGLVRGGVAPDHQKIKNVTRVYDRIAAHDGFRYRGNVKLGRDLTIEELLAAYDQVVLATGAESDRRMGIEGESLDGVYSATEFVGWFNGHPDFQDREFALDGAKRVAIVGNGNVAIDVARILARHPDELVETDITAASLETLRTSTVKEIYLLGRRGPAQAAFSPKEIRELASVPNADLVITTEEATLDPVSAAWLEDSADRDAVKNARFLAEQATLGEGDRPRKVRCLFLVSPTQFVGEEGHVSALTLERNALRPDDRGTPRPRGTGETVTLEADMVFKAIGYRGVPLPGVPFHEKWGIIPNQDGQVVDDDGSDIPGLFVVGWAKRGPTGLIGTNAPDSQATVTTALAKRAAHTASASVEALDARLAERGVQVTSYADWQRLDQVEVEAGQRAGKLREKLTSVGAMLAALRESP